MPSHIFTKHLYSFCCQQVLFTIVFRALNKPGGCMIQSLRRSRLLLAVLLLAIPTSLFAQCGVERWSVKTGTDADIGLVNLNSSTNTTIAALRAPAAPNPIPANNRVSPWE